MVFCHPTYLTPRTSTARDFHCFGVAFIHPPPGDHRRKLDLQVPAGQRRRTRFLSHCFVSVESRLLQCVDKPRPVKSLGFDKDKYSRLAEQVQRSDSGFLHNARNQFVISPPVQSFAYRSHTQSHFQARSFGTPACSKTSSDRCEDRLEGTKSSDDDNYGYNPQSVAKYKASVVHWRVFRLPMWLAS